MFTLYYTCTLKTLEKLVLSFSVHMYKLDPCIRVHVTTCIQWLILMLCMVSDIHPGMFGIAMVYTLNLIGLFQYSMRQSAELEHQVSSIQ